MNKELRKDLEHLIICKDKTITQDLRDDIKMTLDYIDELELNNKSLNSLLNSVKHSLRNSGEHLKIEQNLNYDLYKRIDKAIKYVNEFENIKAYYSWIEDGYEEYNYDEDFKEQLLEILRGNSEET